MHPNGVALALGLGQQFDPVAKLSRQPNIQQRHLGDALNVDRLEVRREAERDARLWDLRVDATRLVARWIWAQARATATASDVEAVDRLVGVLRVREQEGEGSRFDRLRMEQELADLQQVATSAAICGTVASVPSAYDTTPSLSGGGIAIQCPGKNAL